MQQLRDKLRAVTEEDRKNLITVSYSKLDLFTNCQRRFKKSYIEKKYTESESLPLELGTILHKGLEMKGIYLLQNKEVDYEAIKKAVMDGCDEKTEKSSAHLYGVNEIKDRYSKAWFASIEESFETCYPTKIRIYLEDVLPTRIEDPEWKLVGVEIPFEFVYDDRCIVHGFIDRVDEKKDSEQKELRVTDYKSSKKIFDDSKIKTPLQMVVYDLACLFLYDTLPTNHEYDFILLNQNLTTEDGVCSKGYLKRGLKKIDATLDKIDEAKEVGAYPPSPTPLCYWCPYADKEHTPFADKKYGGECQYYSLWTPEHKVFTVNQKYEFGEEEKPKRKLVF